MPVYALPKAHVFPPVSHAEPDGLLAVGGDLAPDRILMAYHQGIFPWYSEGSPILWWSPDPRMILMTAELKISKSMRQVMRSGKFKITYDKAFEEVIEACGNVPRPGQDGTWLTQEMRLAYIQLHQLGFAHSVEVWREGRLVGGLYGLAIGSVFCGESMFSLESNASKAGFIDLVKRLQAIGFRFVDCQVHTPHLESLGAKEVPREEFLDLLETALQDEDLDQAWHTLQPFSTPIAY